MTWLTHTRPNDGGAFAPPDAASLFFDRLVEQSVGMASGFRRIDTTAAKLEIPRLLADGAANWTAEGAEIAVSDPSADVVTATPRKLAALSFMSNELVSDSNPAAQDMVAENLARAVALKLDRGFFEGSGTAPEITGLRNQPGIQTYSMGTDGGPLTNLDPFADALGQLAGANATGTAIVMHPRNWQAITKIKETDTSTKPVIVDGAGSPTAGVRRSIYGVPVHLTSQLSTDEAEGAGTGTNSIYVYEAAQVVAVMRQDVAVEVDTSTAFTSDRTAVRVKMRADLVLPNPEAVIRITGVLPG
ncbi:phage major capsid protein [Saccharopolyspora cebuensis]|uniref:Phage major capsid protein n=1 Tax=Saccharopolyspora cebuensis TaxID=418759 RepID=A0ABV4CEP2_9PSEU